jgi:hypothetical protein
MGISHLRHPEEVSPAAAEMAGTLTCRVQRFLILP